MTATPTGGSGGDYTYQWYKGGTAEGNKIDGATSATYYKASCTAADADNYYCEVKCGTCGKFSDNYTVKVLRLQLMWADGTPVSDYTYHNFAPIGENKATVTIPLESYNYSYMIIDGYKACGNNGTVQRSNYSGMPWVHNVNNQRTGLNCDVAGDYVFTLDYSNYASWTVRVDFPPEKYYYKGNEDGWSTTHEMIKSCDGNYAYYWAKGKNSLNELGKGNNNNFLIMNEAGNVTIANGNNLSSGFNSTDITNMGKWDGDKNACIYNENDFYIIVYYPNTAINSTSSPKICAATKLPGNATTAGEAIYFDNSDGWSSLYYRIGHRGYLLASSLTTVPGTARLYKYTTTAWEGYEAWNIANNQGNTGSHSVYDISTNVITKATNYYKCETDGNVTILLDGANNTEDGCTYYNVNTYPGLLTHNVAITAPSHGTLTVNYTTTANESTAFSSGNRDLAHTANYCVTAEEGVGYTVASITINGTPVANRSWHVLTEDVVVAATFTLADYTITHSAASNGTYTIKVGDAAAVSTNTTANYGQTVTLAASPSEGYELSSWTVTKAGGGTIDVVSNQFTMPNDHVTITATFALKTYTITYNAGTGEGISGSHANDTKTHGVNLTLPGVTFTRTGYTQTGWATSDGGSQAYALSASYTANAAVNLYPVWTAKTTTITIDANTANHGSTTPGTVTATFGSTLPSFTAASGASGYVLTGYYTAATDGTKIINADGTLVRNTAYSTDEATPKWNSDIASLTLYAQYEKGADETCMTFGTTSGDYSTDGTFTNGNYTIITSEINWEGAHAKFGNNVDYISFANANGITAAKIYAKSANVQVTYSTSTDGSTGTSTETISVSEGDYTLKNLTVPSNTKYIKLQRVPSTSTYVNRVCLTEAEPEPCSNPVINEGSTKASFAGGSWAQNSGHTITITATGASSYEWYRNTSANDAGATKLSETSNTLDITADVATGTYFYKAVAKSGACSSSTEWGWCGAMTITAPTTYSVTYHDHRPVGGLGSTKTGSVPVTANYASGATVTVAGNTGSLGFVIDGATATFRGWNTNVDGFSGTFYAADATFSMPASNVDLYAVWSFNINYDADGGTINDSPYPTYYIYTDVSNEDAPVTATLPTNVTKSGYTFDGWYTQNGSGSKITGVTGDSYGDFAGIYILKAKWIEDTGNKVTYNGNGNTSGSVPTDDTDYAAGAIVTVKGNTGDLAKTGYVFRGWNTANDNTGTFYPAGYQFEMPAGAVTLYAVWGTGQVCYTITDFETSNYNQSGNSNKPDGLSKYLYGYMGTKDTEHALTLSSDNSNTKGQNSGVELRLDNRGTLRIYATNVTNATPAGFEDVTQVSFKAKLYNSSGSERTTPYTIKVGSTTVGSGDITGQASDGYFDISTGTLATPKDGYVAIILGGSGSNQNLYIDDIEICTGSGSSGYTVTFDNNGEGTYSKTIENVPSGSKIGVPIPDPTAYGSTFGGWYKENTCTNAWNFASDVVNSDKTLYAKWTSCLPVITTQPVGNTYVQGTVADPLTVVPSGDVTGYQWFSNDENNATTGTPIDGQTTGGYKPETSVIGTTYYYCVVSNACGSMASDVVAIEVNDGKETPCAAWTIDEPTHGGQGFSFSVVAKKQGCSNLWDGTLTEGMLTASDGVVLGAVTVNNTTMTISGTYGVTGSAESPVTFYLSLPATATQTAATLSQTRTFTACAGGAEEFYWSANVSSPLTANTAAKLVSKTTDTEIELSGSSANSSTRTTDTATGIVDGTTYSFLNSDPHHTYIKMGSGNTFHFTTTATATISIQFSTPSNENSGIEIRQSSSSGTVVASKMITSKAGQFQTLTASSVAAGTYYVVAVNKEMNIGEILVVQGSGSAGSITPTLAWSNSDAIAGTVEKNEDAADFSITATRSDANALASLGTISYSSSNASVATINAATGQVTIADNIDFGSADYIDVTITATLSSSGCYKAATITYVLQVNKYVCTEAAGTVTVTSESGCGKVLTISGYEEDALIQWYKDGEAITGATKTTYTATSGGTYYTITHKGCDAVSNELTISTAAATATKIVDEWYVKKDRRTPDIALVQTTNATGFTVSVSGSPIWNSDGTVTTGFAGCGFYLGEDGIIYLKGEKDNGDEPAKDDGSWAAGNVPLSITATACANASPVEITIHKQASTDKPSIAFVVDGGEGKAVDNVTAAKTTSRAIWTYLSTDFTLTGCNAYWTIDEKALRQYYSQYDAILITDDPNTKKPSEKTYRTKGYVNALGTLIDVRPLLTMEAFVSALENWNCVKGKPISPSPRDYVLRLQCKEHAIYKTIAENGTTVWHEMVDGIDNWYITIVDPANSTYADTDDEDDAEGTPALQGFDGKVNVGMLGIGTIANESLQGGIERQKEPAARMMVLGINNKAMAALTEPGKQVINNALHYLLQTDMESLEDCSNYFHGNEGTSTDWFTASNWSAGKVPDPTVRAIILAPCVISGQTARASSVDIAVGGTTGRYKSGTTECEGNISISANGALVLNEGVSRIEDAPNFGVLNRKPTRTSDLAILSESTGNGTLILNNEEGNTQATVAYYSKASTDEADIWNWQYMAVPFNDNSSAYRNYYDSYLYRWAENCSGWEVVPNRGAVYPWVGYTITQVGTKTYYMDGTLVETGEQTFTVPAGADLVLGNSWTAPLQVKQFEDDDFDGLQKKVYLFNTGYDYDKTGTPYEDGSHRYEAGTYVVVPIHSSPYTGDSLISSLQAFTVTSDGGEGTLTLDYERHVRPARSTDKVNAGAMHAPSRMMAQDDKPEVLKIWASGQRFDDRLVVLEREDFSTGYDEGWDGEKVLMGEAAPTVYTVMENGYESVTATNDYEGTLIGFKAGEDSEYTFRFDYDDNAEAIYLLDMDVRMYVRILSGITYTFTCPDKGEHNRFLLTRKAPGISTGYEPIDGSGGIKATKFIKDNKLYILLNGTLYDATGKIVVR
ncbi:MAG: InlB B-repeat-containing protein [Paludibacteraceae bacterium]|nr:InlB B-repeat-containing protein [Paludibacteraceae bacterium]